MSARNVCWPYSRSRPHSKRSMLTMLVSKGTWTPQERFCHVFISWALIILLSCIRDFANKLSMAIISNSNSVLQGIDLSHNLIEDRGTHNFTFSFVLSIFPVYFIQHTFFFGFSSTLFYFFSALHAGITSLCGFLAKVRQGQRFTR